MPVIPCCCFTVIIQHYVQEEEKTSMRNRLCRCCVYTENLFSQKHLDHGSRKYTGALVFLNEPWQRILIMITLLRFLKWVVHLLNWWLNQESDLFWGFCCNYVQNCLIAKEQISSKHENYKPQPPSAAQLAAEKPARLSGWGLSSAAWFCLYNFNITIYTQSHNVLLASSSVISLETVIMKLN